MEFRVSSYLLILGVCILGGACTDQFLQTEPYGSVSEAILFNSEKGAESLLIAAYSNLDGFSGWENGTPWGSAASNWLFGSVAGGDAYKGSEAGDQGDISTIELHSVNANSSFLEAKWRHYYDGISRANQAMKAFARLPQIDESKRALRLAEARFLRAFYHFELYKMFGRIPYIDEMLVDVRVGNTQAVLPKIQVDLLAAIPQLPLRQQEPGRATRGAAQAYLAHTYLRENRFAEAKILFDQVIASGVYALNPSFHDNFNPAKRNTSEGVWEVQQSVNDGTEGDNGNWGDVLNFPYNGGPAGCCGFHQPSQNLVNAFQVDDDGLPLLETYNNQAVKSDDGLKSNEPFTPHTGWLDPRLDWTVGRRGIPYLDWGLHPGASWIRDQSYGGPYSPKKNVFYKVQQGTLTTAAGWTTGPNTNNVKLLRYADVLLQAAECEVELGNLEKARLYVNQVRERAANPSTWVKLEDGRLAANYRIRPYTRSWVDADFARKAVRFERRLELAMEGHRFFDLVRWGIAASEKNAYFATERLIRPYLGAGRFVRGRNEVYPIPTKAITQSYNNGKPTLEQNPGY